MKRIIGVLSIIAFATIATSLAVAAEPITPGPENGYTTDLTPEDYARLPPLEKLKLASALCRSLLSHEKLAPLADLVELQWDMSPKLPPLGLVDIERRADEKERAAIGYWVALRATCLEQLNRAYAEMGTRAEALVKPMLDRIKAARESRMNALLQGLADGKVSYGEFAKMRWRISSDASDSAIIAFNPQRQDALEAKLQADAADWASYQSELATR